MSWLHTTEKSSVDPDGQLGTAATQPADPALSQERSVKISQSSGVRPAKFRLRQRSGIRQQYLFLLLVLFTPLLGIEIYNSFRQYNVQRETVLQGQAETARSVANTTRAFVNDQYSNAKALSYSFNGSRPVSDQQANLILADFRRQNPVVLAYFFAGPDGRVIYADPPELVGRVIAQPELYQSLIAGQEKAVSNLLLSPVDQKTSIFAVATAVRNGKGQLLGMLETHIDTTRLGQVIKFQTGPRGNINVLDKMGQSIYAATVPNDPYERRMLRATPIPDYLEAGLQGREMLVPSTISRIDGMERLGAVVPVAELGWVIAVTSPVEDAVEPILRTIWERMWLFLLVAALALLVGLIYSRYLTRPLLELSRTAVEFGQGNLDRRANINNPAVEIERLAQSLNQMADQVAFQTRSKDAFLSHASHELKTPITASKGFAQMLIKSYERELETFSASNSSDDSALKSQLALRQRQLKMLRSIEHQSNRMTVLINRMLELSHIQTGQPLRHLGPVDLRNLVEQTIETARQLTEPELHLFELVLVPQTSQSSWVVWGDEMKLEQVVLNLLENAIKYSPHGGPIQVSLETKAAGQGLPVPSIELCVQDHGLGLDEADLERVFERYFRASSLDQNISGLGLGLYISSEIVNQHGGRIWVSSPGTGQGSTFHLSLPAAPTPSSTLSPTPTEQ